MVSTWNYYFFKKNLKFKMNDIGDVNYGSFDFLGYKYRSRNC